MATIHSNVNGKILRFCEDWEMEQSFPLPPEGAAYILRFDESTNKALVDDIKFTTTPYKLIGNVLTKNDVAININPIGQARLDAQNFKSNIMIKLTNADTLTQSDLKCTIRVLLRQLGGIKND